MYEWIRVSYLNDLIRLSNRITSYVQNTISHDISSNDFEYLYCYLIYSHAAIYRFYFSINCFKKLMYIQEYKAEIALQLKYYIDPSTVL